MGNEPVGMPVEEIMASISESERPEEKKQDFSGLMARPERALKSSNTWRIA